MPAEHRNRVEGGSSPLRLASQARGHGPVGPEDREASGEPGHSGDVPLDRRLEQLESEVVNLRRGLESRTRIALANGMVAERFGCSSSQAWSLLQRLSSHTNLKLRRVADLVVAEAEGSCTEGDLDELERLAEHVPGLFRDRQDARG